MSLHFLASENGENLTLLHKKMSIQRFALIRIELFVHFLVEDFKNISPQVLAIENSFLAKVFQKFLRFSVLHKESCPKWIAVSPIE